MLKNPFGEVSCEQEIAVLKDQYPSYYFDEAPFNKTALSPERYLIVGRRGSGKTALAEYFKFQSVLPGCTCIDVNEPSVYFKVLSEVSDSAGSTQATAMPRIARIWEFVIWSLVFEQFKHLDGDIRAACYFSSANRHTPSRIVKEILQGLLTLFLKHDYRELTDDLEEFLTSATNEKAKQALFAYSRQHPIIIAMDSLERYATDDRPMMWSVAGLIECASKFNLHYADRGVHLKAFISAEIFPHVAQEVISNTAKHIRKPIHLLWRPRDLVKLIAWRYYRYLIQSGLFVGTAPDWRNFEDVHEKIWVPFFGRDLKNGFEKSERSFAYVLRHTQMKPRQLIIIANAVAELARKEGTFPHLSQRAMIQGIRDAESALATEVINSYSSIYGKAGEILTALQGKPMCFPGRSLDKWARETADQWNSGDYSPRKFKQLAAELGVVGRVRKHNKRRKIIEADFDYATDDSLRLTAADDCVIHPMFFRKLNIDTSAGVIVYPFPDHPDFENVQEL